MVSKKKRGLFCFAKADRQNLCLSVLPCSLSGAAAVVAKSKVVRPEEQGVFCTHLPKKQQKRHGQHVYSCTDKKLLP